MRRVFQIALASAVMAAATPASATLHGFCAAATPCTDNGTNTPTNVNPPVFGFSASPGPATGTLLIDILIPNNLAQPPSFTISGPLLGASTFNANLFDANGASPGTPAWTSGQLDAYLGISASPTNPIGAYLPTTLLYQPGATGFWVYQANLGTRTLPSNAAASDLYTMLLGGGGGSLAQGSYIVAYLNSDGYDATANSGAILEVGKRPPVPEPATWAMMLLGFGGIGMTIRRKQRRGALMQVA